MITPIAGIILAAGSASRMGRPKQLLDWGGRPLVRAVAEHALAARLDRVLVVVGAASDAVATTLADLPVELIENPAYAEGQSTSLRAGIAALTPDVGAALVLLGDQPFVSPAIITRIVEDWRASGAVIVAPVYRGQRGNPVLFAQRVFDELLAIEGDRGARAILAADPARVRMVTFDDDRPLADIDTPDDYQRLVSGQSFIANGGARQLKTDN
jgi:molybdenum cofactor cytidylyltransferase